MTYFARFTSKDGGSQRTFFVNVEGISRIVCFSDKSVVDMRSGEQFTIAETEEQVYEELTTKTPKR